MNNGSIAEQEDLVKKSLFTLLKTHIPSAQLADIDEIVLSYVVSILEDLGTEEDAFDVESFCEMLTAYVPEFVNISHETVIEWIFQLSATLSKRKFKDEPEPEKETIDVSIGLLNLSGSLPSSGRSRHNSSECSNSEFSLDLKKRNHLLSETSDASSDSSGDFSTHEESYLSSEVRILQEMFPRSSVMEVRHCLAVADGDVERAAQIVLHREETGQSFRNSVSIQPISQKQRLFVNDEELKSRIIAKYSYVDKSDDAREHRPVAPKSEPKKLVRYRDNKIVSLKGERYTEVRKDDMDDQGHKVLKPCKPKPH